MPNYSVLQLLQWINSTSREEIFPGWRSFHQLGIVTVPFHRCQIVRAGAFPQFQRDVRIVILNISQSQDSTTYIVFSSSGSQGHHISSRTVKRTIECELQWWIPKIHLFQIFWAELKEIWRHFCNYSTGFWSITKLAATTKVPFLCSFVITQLASRWIFWRVSNQFTKKNLVLIFLWPPQELTL